MKVSIITPSFNTERTIEDNILSVKKQSYPNIEHLVIDGLSKDKTIPILNRLMYEKLSYLTEKDEGLYDAINKGVELCTGDIIGILNADDMFYDEFSVQHIVDAFKNNNTQVTYGNLLYVDSENSQKIIRNWKSKKYSQYLFLNGWMPPHPTFYTYKKNYEKLGFYNTQFKISADYELMLRYLYKHHLKAEYIPQYLVKMRVGGISNKSLNNRILANMEDRKAWEINNLKPNFYTLYLKPMRKIFQFIH